MALPDLLLLPPALLKDGRPLPLPLLLELLDLLPEILGMGALPHLPLLLLQLLPLQLLLIGPAGEPGWLRDPATTRTPGTAPGLALEPPEPPRARGRPQALPQQCLGPVCLT